MMWLGIRPHRNIWESVRQAAHPSRLKQAERQVDGLIVTLLPAPRETSGPGSARRSPVRGLPPADVSGTARRA